MSLTAAPRTRRHLFSLADMSAEDLLYLLDTAESFAEVGRREVKKVPTLRGKTVVNLFMESSTRTRTSFEIAEKRLSAEVVNFSASGSSVEKGETLKDTMLTLNAMGPDIVVLRHKYAGSPQFVSRYTSASIINAGDGAREHPTQGLLDLFTIRRRFGRIAGLRVAIVGDIAHSRVVRSALFGLRTLGAEVVLCGPPTMLPHDSAGLGVQTTSRLEQAIDGADVVMMLRVQFERQREQLFPNRHEYFRRYGLTAERLRHAKPEAIVMHPGPMNRGVEISSEVADGPRSVITDQVEAGVAARMAVLFWVSGGAETEA